MRRGAIGWAGIAVVAMLSHRVGAQIESDRLLNAAREPQNWLAYSGGYFSQRFSNLTQITPANVKNLELKLMYQAAVAGGWQAVDIVPGGSVRPR